MSEKKEFYVVIKGEKIFVSEEVYRAYVRPIRKEQRKERRYWKCRIVGEAGKLVRCNKKCSECQYAEAGNKATGNILSLDKLLESGFEIADKRLTPEELYIEKESGASLFKYLHSAIEKLPYKQRTVIELFYFQDKTQEEIALILGVKQPAVSKLLMRGLQGIKTFFEKFKIIF